MQMMSPEQFIELKKQYIVDELQKEMNELENEINMIREAINNNVPDIFNGGRDTRLKMYESYYEELNKLIKKISDI